MMKKKRSFHPQAARETRKKSRLAVKYDVCVCFCLARFFLMNTRLAELKKLISTSSPLLQCEFLNLEIAQHTRLSEWKFEFFIISKRLLPGRSDKIEKKFIKERENEAHYSE